ncbi:MAG TPA: hypothetical protein VKV26_02035 [Dehalococcoidia bacterium]|nr:hypothetical protein [Dehalococcoidia bacterium]
MAADSPVKKRAIATVLGIDYSRDASRYGAFPALKNAALALDNIVRECYPHDALHVVQYSAYAREIWREQLANLNWHERVPGTNLHAALLLAQAILRECPTRGRRIILLSGSEPTAHFERGRSYFAYPPSPVTVRETIRAAQWCAANGTELTAFWVGHGSFKYAKDFYDRFAAEAGVKVIRPSLEPLSNAVMEAYERGRGSGGAA